MPSVTLDSVVAVHPRVSIRPEPFGALLYHFSTRQLSFLKDRMLLEVVRACDGTRTLGEALGTAGVPAAQTGRYLRAVETLVASRMLESASAGTAPRRTAPDSATISTEAVA